MRPIILALAFIGMSGCIHPVTPMTSDTVDTAIVTPSAEQVKTFGPMAALAGTRWYAVPANGSSEPVGDVQYWYWEFGGKVLAQRHALEDGSYGGVSYIYPNAGTGALDYVYVTSGGFFTRGSFTFNEDGSWTALEDVEGHQTITKVRSTGMIDPDGVLTSRSEYFQSGEWVPGHAFNGTPTDRDVPEVNGATDD